MKVKAKKTTKPATKATTLLEFHELGDTTDVQIRGDFMGLVELVAKAAMTNNSVWHILEAALALAPIYVQQLEEAIDED
jgi:hypothetical protein